MAQRGQRDGQIERGTRVGRREFLALGGTGLVVAGWARAARAQAKPSGEIVAGVSERALTLDPANHYSISATSVLRHIFDPLVDVSNDSKFSPALAESWRAVSTTQWRFTLRKGVTFHDGTPFTADSVVYTLKRVRDNTKLIKAFVYQDIESVDKDGDYGVVVTSKRPFGSLPAHLTMLGMLPPSAATNEEAFFQKPVGTGPFKFQSWTHGDHVVMTANPAYWKPGVPKAEKVTFRFIPELSTRSAGLRAGELHVIDVLLRLGAHAPRPRLVLRSVVHQGRRREADPLRQPARGATHRRGPRARPQGAPGEIRGAREDPLGGGGGDLALLQRGHLRDQRPAPELRGAPRLLRPAE